MLRLQKECVIGALAVLSAVFMTTAEAQVPQTINHQGYVESDGTPFDGTGSFRFALVNDTGENLWTQDNTQLGTSNLPNTARSVPVTNGLYSVPLGAATPIPASVLSGIGDVALRVWFDDGTNGVERLTPDQPLHSVPYAQIAATTESVPEEISVSQVNYSPPRTHVLPIPPTAFRGQSESDSYVVGAGSLFGSGNTRVVAPVVLPQGAVMTKLSVWFEDDDPDSYLEVNLRRADIDSAGAFTAASVDGDGLSGTGLRETTTISGPVIDNTAYKYGIRVFDANDMWEVNDSRLLHVAIEYEIGEVK